MPEVISLALCLLALAALALLLYLTCMLRFRRPAAGLAAPLDPDLPHLRRKLEELEARQRESESRASASACVEPAAVRAGMNLSRRSHALRLSRRGERPEQIAAALSVPLGEVNLLLKVHRLAMDPILQARNALKSAPSPADKASSGQTDT